VSSTKERYCTYCGSPLERCYSVESAAEILDCSEQAIRNWVRDGVIGYYKYGRMVRIPESEIRKLGEYHPSLKESVEELLGK